MTKNIRLTPKQEKFVEHLAIHGNKTVAYKHAYKSENMSPKTINEAACRLAASSKVSARVQELQELAWLGQTMNLERLIGMHVQVYEEAMNNGQYAAANAAAQSIGKLKGHYTDKSEVKIDQTIEHRMEVMNRAKADVLDLIAGLQTEKSRRDQSIPENRRHGALKPCRSRAKSRLRLNVAFQTWMKGGRFFPTGTWIG